jgi:hypothetical protein
MIQILFFFLALSFVVILVYLIYSLPFSTPLADWVAIEETMGKRLFDRLPIPAILRRPYSILD